MGPAGLAALLFFLLLMMMLPASALACNPECRWACDEPVCHASCRAECDRPRCAPHCETREHEHTCEEPYCWTTCDSSAQHCPADSCPNCEIKCSPYLYCRHSKAVCVPVCEPPVCGWHCKKPTDCPHPKCQLMCEHPACPKAPPAPSDSSAPVTPLMVFTLSLACLMILLAANPVLLLGL